MFRLIFGLIPFSLSPLLLSAQQFRPLLLKGICKGHLSGIPSTSYSWNTWKTPLKQTSPFFAITAVENCSSSPSTCWRVCRFLTSLSVQRFPGSSPRLPIVYILWSLLPHSTCSFRFSHCWNHPSCGAQFNTSSQPFETVACAFLPSSLTHTADTVNHSSPHSQHFLESFMRSCIIVTSENLVSHLNSFLGIYLTNW